MRLTLIVYRKNPERDVPYHPAEYRLEIERGMTVLDALIRLKNQQDGTLSFRYSCQSAICGSCCMTINGTDKLACRTSIRKELERHGDIVVAPLKNLPVLKDLVVDMAPFWQKIRAVTPWLHPVASVDSATASSQTALTGRDYQFHNVDACIMCGACVAACTSHEVSPGFLGPAALAKADRFMADPRESRTAKRERLTELDKPDGMWDCVRCNYCVEVCPKDVKPMDAIIRLRRAAIGEGLTSTGGARHITGFVEIVQREGRLNETLMPLKIMGFNLKRLLHTAPLALRMFLKGKLPNPLAPPLPGLAHIRSYFASSRSDEDRL